MPSSLWILSTLLSLHISHNVSNTFLYNSSTPPNEYCWQDPFMILVPRLGSSLPEKHISVTKFCFSPSEHASTQRRLATIMVKKLLSNQLSWILHNDPWPRWLYKDNNCVDFPRPSAIAVQERYRATLPPAIWSYVDNILDSLKPILFALLPLSETFNDLCLRCGRHFPVPSASLTFEECSNFHL